MTFQNSPEFAQQLDNNDPLKEFRNQFIFPQHNGKNVVYLTGNSLGLQPKSARSALLQELDDWALHGLEGHFNAQNPWFSYHEMFKEPLSKLVGANPVEVTAMSGLTSNLHLLMVSFYRPTKQRFKILCEEKAFPSDQYVMESQVKFHGFDPAEAIVEIPNSKGKHEINHEEIIQAIADHGNEIALVMIGGVNYYSGQLFDMESITKEGHRVGALVGFDLAHAAGNVELKLHQWHVDFAAWCSYKYLNSGPGSIAGIFVHEKHARNTDLPKFTGWWGTDPTDRFQMRKGFKADVGADSWQLSNAPVFSMAVHKKSLDLFMDAGMGRLFEKSKKLTGYLQFVIDDVSGESDKNYLQTITPREDNRRGAQISLLTHGMGKDLFDFLTNSGVVADWREPNVIRIAPVPLYNSFMDVYEFGQILKQGISNCS